jgi:hypothetical protein
VAREKDVLPLAFNVEVGAYVNVMRTSLDILATSLARRFSMPRPDKVYFPVVETRSQFLAQTYKGIEFVKRLPAAERGILESLKPYKGGNDVLWALHSLDIRRKHRQLLTVEPHPSALSITGVGINFTPLGAGGWIRSNDETILGFLRKGTPKPKFQYAPFIGFNESETGMSHAVLEALDQFARLTYSIVSLFDTA